MFCAKFELHAFFNSRRMAANCAAKAACRNNAENRLWAVITRSILLLFRNRTFAAVQKFGRLGSNQPFAAVATMAACSNFRQMAFWGSSRSEESSGLFQNGHQLLKLFTLDGHMFPQSITGQFSISRTYGIDYSFMFRQ
jgi:hypothetical protein